jgi:hypothetical protein
MITYGKPTSPQSTDSTDSLTVEEEDVGFFLYEFPEFCDTKRVEENRFFWCVCVCVCVCVCFVFLFLLKVVCFFILQAF